MLKNQKGITLIALVITIIVLLILAGITIALIAGQDNAPDKAVEGRARNAIGAAKDAINMKAATNLSTYYEENYVTNPQTASFGSKAEAAYAARTAGGDVVVEASCVAPVAPNPNANPAVAGSDGTIVLTSEGYSSEGTVDKTSGVISWSDITTE